jgi:hypothetical protein
VDDVGAPEGVSQYFTLDNDVDELGTHTIWETRSTELAATVRARGEIARTES